MTDTGKSTPGWLTAIFGAIGIGGIAALLTFLYWFILVNFTHGSVEVQERKNGNPSLDKITIEANLNEKPIGVWSCNTEGKFNPSLPLPTFTDLNACASLFGNFKLTPKLDGYEADATNVGCFGFFGSPKLILKKKKPVVEQPPAPIRSINNSQFELQPGVQAVLSTSMGRFTDNENYITVFLVGQESSPVCEWNNRPDLSNDQKYTGNHSIQNTASTVTRYSIDSRHKNKKPGEGTGDDRWHGNSLRLASDSPNQIQYEIDDGVNKFTLGITVR